VICFIAAHQHSLLCRALC